MMVRVKGLCSEATLQIDVEYVAKEIVRYLRVSQ